MSESTTEVIQSLLDGWNQHDANKVAALYARVATNTIREVMSPLDRLTPLVPPKKNEPKGEPPA